MQRQMGVAAALGNTSFVTLLMRIGKRRIETSGLSCDGSMGFERERLEIALPALPAKANEVDRDVRRQGRLR
jgi:hypothetical protein